MLQRFAITYLIVATTGVIFMESFETNLKEGSKLGALRDCFSVWQRWIVAGLVTILHCLLVFMLPVPGCPTGKNITIGYGVHQNNMGKKMVIFLFCSTPEPMHSEAAGCIL